MKKITGLAVCAVLIALCLSSCNYDNKSAVREKETTETTAVQTTAVQTTEQPTTQIPTELKAEVLVPSETQLQINEDRSDPDDPNDATGFVSISDYIPDVMLDIRYYSTYNFIGERIDGYEQPVALLSKEAASALKNAADDLEEKGYRLKIFDAYRPQSAVDHFAAWAADLEDTRMKPYFYPELDKSVLFDQGYIAYRSGHSRGCTVDLTLFDMDSGKELDMGGTFDYFGEMSHPDYWDISEKQRANRNILKEAMVNNGFTTCATEWWHFSLADEPYPYTYFTFPVSMESLK